MPEFGDIDRPGQTTVLAGAPPGLDARVLADLAVTLAERRVNEGPVILHVARDGERMRLLEESLAFFAPDLRILSFPAWDCLPYDRVSPHPKVTAERVGALALLVSSPPELMPAIVLTTVNSVLQRVPGREAVSAASYSARSGDTIDREALLGFLAQNGYERAGTVREAGEFAVRGGIVDVFPPGADEPLRLDLFGDELEAVRAFDPLTQITTRRTTGLALGPVGEVRLDETAVQCFRAGYREAFGPVTRDDPLYRAISEGRRHIGMDHWLPLFHEHLETVFDLVPEAMVTMDGLTGQAVTARFEMIQEQYAAREVRRGSRTETPYNPLPPDRLYLTAEEWNERLATRARAVFGSYGTEAVEALRIEIGGRSGRNFAEERAKEDLDLFATAREHADALRRVGRRIVVACFSEGSRERMRVLMDQHEWGPTRTITSWPEASALPAGTAALAILGLEQSATAGDIAIVSEPDLLGDRLVRRVRRARRAEAFLTEVSSLAPGDFVVHLDHGIGRYEGLQTLDVAGAPHDCVWLSYAGGDRLFIPVENIEVLSRYGSSESAVALDRIGGAGWQARKARLKERIREIADELIKVAAARVERRAPVLTPPPGLYEDFCARFPFDLTPDQQTAIDDIVDNLGSGQPADRLICGDVGYGKTEVALRAAFIAAMAGKQVAVVVPTTLLCRQHYDTFSNRFAGFPVRIAQISRMIGAKDAAIAREALADGQVDIVIGTHALLTNKLTFRNLGLLVVDEEQHFGVAHKERLKQLRSDVHVLTMTATPIPRTLQMAMTGLRDLSLIATPPVDRMAVRTFILPFDEVTVREAILREQFRGGQTFFVCPRIRDIADAEAFLRANVAEAKFAIAHGRIPAADLDRVMQSFYDGAFDVLLSTNIIESGLDIPAANTMIVYRADRFGLAQLYQLRGRIGRSKVRAYAYLTVLRGKTPSANAEQRLHVMESLDELGAGFSLASYDLDNRGAGNLLGEEQSGHIKEVGIELYQEMLEEAVAAARDTPNEAAGAEKWSPQVGLGTSVLIPDTYVADLDARLGLYRRLARLESAADIDAMAAELIDRFGPYPDEVQHLLDVVGIKSLCRSAGIEKLEAGPRGATINFRDNRFENPAGLVQFIGDQAGTSKLRPDHTLVYIRNWDDDIDRLAGVRRLVADLAQIASQASVTTSGPDSDSDSAPSRSNT